MMQNMHSSQNYTTQNCNMNSCQHHSMNCNFNGNSGCNLTLAVTPAATLILPATTTETKIVTVT